MDVHEEFLLSVPKVIVDISLFILFFFFTTNRITKWKADSIFALGHK